MDIVRQDETLDDLQIKDIKILQKKSGFRFGVDAVLLANFAKAKENHKVIDLCTGTGIIAFIMAGKTPAQSIKGIDIQKEMIDMAKRSVDINGLQNRMEFINEDLKNLKELKKIEKAHVVTVNPPYKLGGAGIKNPEDSLAIARHEICCNLEDIIIASRALLRDNGRLYMIHRPERLIDIFCLMRKHKIEPKRVRMVHPNIYKAPTMVLIEGQRDGGAFLRWDNPLYVYDEHGDYSKEINEIYGR